MSAGALPSTLVPLERLPGWPEALAAHIEARRYVPFAWVVNDCCTFACDGIVAIAGTDPMADLRTAYHDERDQARLVQRLGGLREVAVARLPRRVHALQANRGDLVCVGLEGRPTLGLVSGNGHWCAPGVNGLVFRPMAEVVDAFAVG